MVFLELEAEHDGASDSEDDVEEEGYEESSDDDSGDAPHRELDALRRQCESDSREEEDTLGALCSVLHTLCPVLCTRSGLYSLWTLWTFCPGLSALGSGLSLPSALHSLPCALDSLPGVVCRVFSALAVLSSALFTLCTLHSLPFAVCSLPSTL
jgi:hypothetical protein